MNVLPYGETALLVETDADQSPAALARALAGHDGVLEAVPGARTVLVVPASGGLTAETVRSVIADSGESAGEAATVEIPVDYDGPDLDEVAELTGRSAKEVVRLHASARYTVAFCGFAPGFAYLTGLDPALHVARRDEPRTSVPAGSVAVAGEFSAVYPRRSPGGWRLIGATDVTLWDTARTPPALLVPGTVVRFVPR